MVRNSDIIKAARSFVGVPLRHQGRVTIGMDCVGLIVCSFKKVGILLEDCVNYRITDRSLLEKLLDDQFQKSNSGIVVSLCRNPRHPYPGHLGIITDTGIIHASQVSQTISEHPIGYLSPLIVQHYTHKEVSNG